VGVITTTLLALTYPVFTVFGLSDKAFVITSVVGGFLVIWFSLDIFESKAQN
jgi:hypothetical protein